MQIRLLVRINLVVLLCLALLVSCSKSDNGQDIRKYHSKEYNEYAQKFSRLIVKGSYDSLAITAKELFRIGQNNRDTNSMLFSGFMVSQAYFFIDNSDSTQAWLDKTIAINQQFQDKEIEMYLNHLKGISKLLKLDYLGALKYFEEGLSVAREGANYKMQITFLTNIVNLFYVRGDKYGLVYARKMEDLYANHADEIQATDLCMVMLSMAQMLYLNKEYDEALVYTRRCEEVTLANKIDRHNNLIHLLYANIYSVKNDKTLAEAHYESAFRNTANEPSMLLLIYLNYGNHKERYSEYYEAKRIYKTGLDESFRYNMLIYRENFLTRLLKLSLDAVDNADVLKFSQLLIEYKESVDMCSNDQEFYSLLQSYQEAEYNLETYKNELTLQRARNLLVIYSAVIIIVIILIFFMWFLYRRKLAIYRALFTQYHNAIKLADCDKQELSEQENSQKQSSLFAEIDKLMRVEKIYRRKDISLEMLASRLNSNRDYVSKAINTCSGSSFSNYVNMYRISEAVDILSDLDNPILLKELAHHLGYSSLAVFSRAFMNQMGCSASSYRAKLMNGDV